MKTISIFLLVFSLFTLPFKMINAETPSIKSLNDIKDFKKKTDQKQRSKKENLPPPYKLTPEDYQDNFQDLLNGCGHMGCPLNDYFSFSKIEITTDKKENVWALIQWPHFKNSDSTTPPILFSGESKGDEICHLFGLEEMKEITFHHNKSQNKTMTLQTFHLVFDDSHHHQVVKKILCKINE